MRRTDLSISAACAAALVALAGCGKTLTEDDCKRIADNMREVWQAESQKAAVADGASSDKAAAVIKTEGDKLVGDWSGECKKDLSGKRVDPREVDCLLSAKTIAQINKCSSEP